MFDELRSALINSKVASSRDADIFLRVLGLDGRKGDSLRRTAEGYDLSSERVRQIYEQVGAELMKVVHTSEHFAGVRSALTDIVAAVRAILPATDDAATSDLMARRLICGDGRMASSAIRAANLILGNSSITVDQWGDKTVLITDHTPRCYPAVSSLARKIGSSSGAVSIRDLARIYEASTSISLGHNVVRTMLECCATLLCIDDDLWFHFPGGYSDAIARAESHVGSLGPCSVSNLAEVCYRITRSQYKVALPSGVMAALLRANGFEVSGDVATKSNGVSHQLTSVQLKMIGILREMGGRANPTEYMRACVVGGINSSTARVYLRRSGLFKVEDGVCVVAS